MKELLLAEGAVVRTGGPLLALAIVVGAWGAPLSVDLSSREQSRQFYRAVYFASEGVPIGFTGDVASGRAGDISAAFREAARVRVNFFRAFGGLPGEIQFNATYNAKCQQAALMGSLNNSISHTPPTSSRGYTPDAAEACGKSNLALIESSPEAITGYIRDASANNRDVGHRRWVLYPQTREMGVGDVPASLGFNASNALWIFDEKNVAGPRPATREPYVAWPPPGFVPYPLVFPRWSLSVANANFSQAFVAVRKNGTPVAVAVGSVNNGYGENTIVWTLEGRDPSAIIAHDKPDSDVTYAVEITNVIVGGSTQTYRYSVTVYDPDVAGPEGPPVRVEGPDAPAVARPNLYRVTAPAFFGRLQWRTLLFSPASPRFDAEGGTGLGGLIANTNGYSPVVTDIRGAGGAGYRLVHPAPLQFEHTLTLPDTYYAGDKNAVLTFLSRLGYATARQIARVQVSVDEGVAWSDVFRQPGDGTAGEFGFRVVSIPLAALERRTFRVRFNYTYVNGGTMFSQTDPTVGWYLDDITLSGVRKVAATAATDVAGGSLTFTPAEASEVGVQARGMIDVYPSEWSRVAGFVANPGLGNAGATGSTAGDPALPLPPPATGTARLANLSVRTTAGSASAALVVGFNLAGSAAKPVLIRAIGPTLGVFGVGGALADPTLVLKTAAGLTVLENDNWGGAAPVTAAAGRLGAFPLDPGTRDSAMLPALNPGSYTATVSPVGEGAAAGVTLVELYDAEPASGSRLTNVSARAQVGTGGDILVVGFAVSGSGVRNVLIRAIGPTLAGFGLTGTLADPKLEILQGPTLVRASDNWNANLTPLFASVGAFPLAANSADAALALALGPGTYTAQVSGVGGTTGVALIEVYELP